jgi:hypothetical protein
MVGRFEVSEAEEWVLVEGPWTKKKYAKLKRKQAKEKTPKREKQARKDASGTSSSANIRASKPSSRASERNDSPAAQSGAASRITEGTGVGTARVTLSPTGEGAGGEGDMKAEFALGPPPLILRRLSSAAKMQADKVAADKVAALVEEQTGIVAEKVAALELALAQGAENERQKTDVAEADMVEGPTMGALLFDRSGLLDSRGSEGGEKGAVETDDEDDYKDDDFDEEGEESAFEESAFEIQEIEEGVKRGGVSPEIAQATAPLLAPAVPQTQAQAPVLPLKAPGLPLTDEEGLPLTDEELRRRVEAEVRKELSEKRARKNVARKNVHEQAEKEVKEGEEVEGQEGGVATYLSQAYSTLAKEEAEEEAEEGGVATYLSRAYNTAAKEEAEEEAEEERGVTTYLSRAYNTAAKEEAEEEAEEERGVATYLSRAYNTAAKEEAEEERGEASSSIAAYLSRTYARAADEEGPENDLENVASYLRQAYALAADEDDGVSIGSYLAHTYETVGATGGAEGADVEGAGVHYCTTCNVSSATAEVEEDEEQSGAYYCTDCWDDLLAEEEDVLQEIKVLQEPDPWACCATCGSEVGLEEDADSPGIFYCSECWEKLSECSDSSADEQPLVLEAALEKKGADRKAREEAARKEAEEEAEEEAKTRAEREERRRVEEEAKREAEEQARREAHTVAKRRAKEQVWSMCTDYSLLYCMYTD